MLLSDIASSLGYQQANLFFLPFNGDDVHLQDGVDGWRVGCRGSDRRLEWEGEKTTTVPKHRLHRETGIPLLLEMINGTQSQFQDH